MDAVLEFLDPWGLCGLALVGIAVAALANGMETGLYRLNRIRLRLRVGQNDPRARMLLTLVRDLRGVIIVCLIGYNGGVYLATMMITTLVAASGWADTPIGVEVLATAILTPIFFVFTDVTPKSIFALEADRWAYPMARPMRWAYQVLRGIGLVPALKGVSELVLRVSTKRGGQAANPFTPRQRLRAVIRESAAEGVISGYQDKLVERVLGLRERPIQEVMIPLRSVAAVPSNISHQRLSTELRRHSFSRLPVYENHRDRVVGIIRINDVLAGPSESLDLGRIMSRDLVRMSPETTVSAAMFRMRKDRAAMAIVEDARGRALGIITIKDLVEEIVGELAAW
ncbi:MAG TPA: CNNM domain-containing protein [Phycisphaerae bacterium]|nr:CNNM domain-containing protein [Phycisphaerae bacterium]